MSFSGNTPDLNSGAADVAQSNPKPDTARAPVADGRADGRRPHIKEHYQALGLCVDCKQPSKTQRCRDCYLRVEANTNRRRVRRRMGAPTLAELDLVDMRCAARAIISADKQRADLVNATDARATQSQQKHITIEMLSQVTHARRFLEEIERRHGVKRERTNPLLEAAP